MNGGLVDREREPVILLIGRRRSGKTHTRMQWSQHLPMAPIVAGEVKAPRVETGEVSRPTREITEYRVQAGEQFVRVIDMPGEILDTRSPEAGRAREALEPLIGRIGGVLLCVAPPLPPQGSERPRPGFVAPGLLPVLCELFPPGDKTNEPTVAQLEEVRARIDSAMAFCEQLFGRLESGAVPFAVQMGFSDLVSLGATDEDDARNRAWLHARYGRIFPGPGQWSNPASIGARLEEYENIDDRVSRIFGDIAVWIRKRWPRYAFWLFASSNVDDSLGHRSAAMGLVYLVDQALGREIYEADRAFRAEAQEQAGRLARARKEEAERRAQAPRETTQGARRAKLGPIVRTGAFLGVVALGASSITWSRDMPGPEIGETLESAPGTVLREAPLLWASEVSAPRLGPEGLPSRTRLVVLDRSKDGSWLRVSASLEGDSVEGWMQRSAVSPALPAQSLGPDTR